MEVFIQLRDDCNGTYVITSSTGFDVVELKGGTSNAAFSYRVSARRKGFEDMRLAKMGGPTPEEVRAEQITFQAHVNEERATLEQNRQKVEAERTSVRSMDQEPSRERLK